MSWCELYVVVAVVVAVTAFAAANFIRTDEIVAPNSPGKVSALAGALWPIVIIGVAELALTAFLRRGRSAH